MRKLIIAGLACMILLVACTAGCVESGDPIVGTWVISDPKSGLDDLGLTEEEYNMAYEMQKSLKMVFTPDRSGTASGTYEGSPYELDITWRNIGNGEYEVYFEDNYYSKIILYLDGSKLYDEGHNLYKKV